MSEEKTVHSTPGEPLYLVVVEGMNGGQPTTLTKTQIEFIAKNSNVQMVISEEFMGFWEPTNETRRRPGISH